MKLTKVTIDSIELREPRVDVNHGFTHNNRNTLFIADARTLKMRFIEFVFL